MLSQRQPQTRTGQQFKERQAPSALRLYLAGGSAHRLLYDVLHPVQALGTLQVSVVLFVCPVWVFCRRAVGGLLLSVYQRVRRLFGKPGLLLVLVHVVLFHFGVVCPYFRHFGVFVLVILDGDRVGTVLLNGVLDLVQLLPHVVGGVVLRGRVRMAARLPSLPHAPVEGRHQATDPSHG